MVTDILHNWSKKSAERQKQFRQVLERADQKKLLKILPALHEEAFSKIKSVLRRIGARTREALQDGIDYACATVTASDARGWFRHCGYAVPDPQAQART